MISFRSIRINPFYILKYILLFSRHTQTACAGAGAQLSPLSRGVATPFVLYLRAPKTLTTDLPIRRLLSVAQRLKSPAIVGFAHRHVINFIVYAISFLLF